MTKPGVIDLNAAVDPNIKAASPPETSETIKPDDQQDVDVTGVGTQLAELLHTQEFHPVLIFGSAGSGKTSLLTSLIAAVRTEPGWQCSADLTEPIMAEHSEYGRYLRRNAELFMGRTVQEFIEGRAAPRTNVQLPFFVPVEFRPSGKSYVKLAFMESNGEWYQPDRNSERFFSKLKPEIEELLRNYQGGITFIHILPYTQAPIGAQGVDVAADVNNMKDASIAIAGALSAYEAVRTDKTNDFHLMLVTKWDAHKAERITLLEKLSESSEGVEEFVNSRYHQAYARLRGLDVRESQLGLSAYCSGVITESNVLTLKVGNELRPVVISFPKKLWKWLYGNALESSNQMRRDPFPPEKHQAGVLVWFWKTLDRMFS